MKLKQKPKHSSLFPLPHASCFIQTKGFNLCLVTEHCPEVLSNKINTSSRSTLATFHEVLMQVKQHLLKSLLVRLN